MMLKAQRGLKPMIDPSGCVVLVLDEADTMVQRKGFAADTTAIRDMIQHASGRTSDCQLLLFSATYADSVSTHICWFLVCCIGWLVGETVICSLDLTLLGVDLICPCFAQQVCLSVCLCSSMYVSLRFRGSRVTQGLKADTCMQLSLTNNAIYVQSSN
jgi:hypothetical protein